MLSVPEQKNVVIVSGMSGSGKSTALDVFEDMGFFCVDGLPVRMAPVLVEFFLQSMAKEYSGLALGMDLRQADFAGQWREALKDMEKFSVHPALIFLDASDQTLLRRYATTRRPHTPWPMCRDWKQPSSGNGKSCGPSALRPIWWWTRRITPSTICAG